MHGYIDIVIHQYIHTFKLGYINTYTHTYIHICILLNLDLSIMETLILKSIVCFNVCLFFSVFIYLVLGNNT